MTSYLADVVLHLDESLPPGELETVEEHIHRMGGIYSACNRSDKPHLIQIAYDPEKVKSRDILVKLRSEGLHGQLVGL